jgi:succinoglycan biosynthesis protein ExoA
MNLGLRAARGAITVRVDAHGVVGPDYVREVVSLLGRHPNVVAVGGPYLPATDHLLERVTALARSSRVGVGGGWYSDKTPAEHLVRTVGCPAYRRDAVIAAGMFDPAMAYAEDDELHWRLVKRGGDILFAPALRQYNRPRATLHGLARQYWNYGRGRLRVLRKHPDFLLPRHLAPSAFVCTMLLLALLAIAVPWTRHVLLALLVTYVVALAGAGLAARSHGWREALLVPCAVGLIHVAYGGGMLCDAMAGLLPVTPHRKESV